MQKSVLEYAAPLKKGDKASGGEKSKLLTDKGCYEIFDA
jgi:hypothetical protein